MTLALESNGISDKGLSLILGGVVRNRCIKNVHIRRNEIMEHSAEQL